MYVPALFVFAWVIFCLRAAYLAEATYQQRNALRLALRQVKDYDEWKKKWDLFLLVSFDDHYWRRITFRNPWEIYSDELAHEISEAK